ncbi:MAG: P1 family peptidase [Oceanicaulis sp.]|uniref:P1 family peptidase n=1 Tax=Glycocaulis sp. TaxID=1969725 RepID=UPI0025BF469E|nr:P1 family peptidase [Glycocaulis sp.]MCC5981976.1 P1 family peptidase [Oceanicaulis sp.]MCH8520595.1 P1 family peptidase [Glycocaulis sp.]
MQNDITDIAGLGVGQAHEAAARTGVTVCLFDAPAIAAIDVRGGGPGTRESDVLRPGGLVDAVDAIVLSGGSVYGLGAADAVCAALGAEGRGYALMPRAGVPPSPIVPAAILYDLANGGAKNWGQTPPYAALGRAALEDAKTGKPVTLGKAGAGFGAMAGSLPGGTGSASAVTADGIRVAALACVNSFGSVRVPGSNAYWAAPFERDGEFGGHRLPDYPLEELEDWGAAKFNPAARENTTLAIVVTDAALTPDQARRVAVMAQDGMARAIRPVHTPFDGDVVFAASTARRALPGPSAFSTARIGALAADCLARAIARGVHAAS